MYRTTRKIPYYTYLKTQILLLLNCNLQKTCSGPPTFSISPTYFSPTGHDHKAPHKHPCNHTRNKQYNKIRTVHQTYETTSEKVLKAFYTSLRTHRHEKHANRNYGCKEMTTGCYIIKEKRRL